MNDRPMERKQIEYINKEFMERHLNGHEALVLLTPATSHSLIAWTNIAFERTFGWTNAEIIGREIFFFHGDGANFIPVAKNLTQLEKNPTVAAVLSQTLYSKDGSFLQSQITIFPVYEQSTSGLAFMALKFHEIGPRDFPSELLFPFPKIFEVGLPIDRREYCKRYHDYYGPSTEKNSFFNSSHFKEFCARASMTNIVSLLMACPDNMIICNRHGEMLAASAAWYNQFRFTERSIMGEDLIRAMRRSGASETSLPGLISCFNKMELAAPPLCSVQKESIDLPKLKSDLLVHPEISTVKPADEALGFLRLHTKSPSLDYTGHNISPVTIAFSHNISPCHEMYIHSKPKAFSKKRRLEDELGLVSSKSFNDAVSTVTTHCSNALRLITEQITSFSRVQFAAIKESEVPLPSTVADEIATGISIQSDDATNTFSNLFEEGFAEISDFEVIGTLGRLKFVVSICQIASSCDDPTNRLYCILFTVVD